MNKLFVLAVGLFIFVLMSNSCKPSRQLYKCSNQTLKKDTSVNMAECIRRNFFYNRHDSTYVENINLIPNLRNEYYDILYALDKSSLINIFGVPHYTDSISVGYIIKKFDAPNYAGRAYERFFIFNKNKLSNITWLPVDRGRDSDFNVNKMIKKVYSANKNLPSVDYIEPRSIKLETNKIDKFCKIAKKNFRNEIFYNTKSNCFIINALIAEPISSWDNIKCIDSFSLNEVKSIFGSPNLERNDTIFYKLENEPFIQKQPFGEKNNDGKLLFYF